MNDAPFLPYRSTENVRQVNIPLEVLSFNDGDRTGFSDEKQTIHIRGDILPDVNSTNVRDLLTQRAVLAHEYYGHYKAHPSKYKVGDWRDEYNASRNAALNAPNLTDEERRMLMLDAYDRAKESGVVMEYDDEARRMIYGY